MEQIINFFKTLYQDYLWLILVCVVLFAVLVFLAIIYTVRKQKAKKQKDKETFIKESVQALTPEEIEKISNNSSDPNAIKKTLTDEINVLNSEEDQEEKPAKRIITRKKSEEKKAPAKKKKAEVKKEEKPEEPTPQQELEKPAKKKKSEIKKEEPIAVSQPKVEPQPEPVPQPEPETQSPTPAKNEKKSYVGKWKIKSDDFGFYACLTASNGVLVLKTEYYKSLSGVKNGIETIKKNIDDGNFIIAVDKYGHYRYKLLSQSKRPICSSEDYSSKAKCESGIESVKRFAKTAIIIIEEK